MPGASVEVDLEESVGLPKPDPDAPLLVLTEAPRLVVVDKPAGIAVHPLSPGEGGTLANRVAARYPECASASPSPREGGAVHRLDSSRPAAAWHSPGIGRPGRRFRAQFRGRDVEKRYLALVAGRLAAGGVCSVPLAQRGSRVVPAPDEFTLDRLAGKGFSARPAETHYEVTRRFRDHTLVEVKLVTGVMHQIRAHFAYLGHAVVGDAQYGGEAGARLGLARHFLHASRLGLEAPGGARVEAESPMPSELTAVLDALPGDGD